MLGGARLALWAPSALSVSRGPRPLDGTGGPSQWRGQFSAAAELGAGGQRWQPSTSPGGACVLPADGAQLARVVSGGVHVATAGRPVLSRPAGQIYRVGLSSSTAEPVLSPRPAWGRGPLPAGPRHEAGFLWPGRGPGRCGLRHGGLCSLHPLGRAVGPSQPPVEGRADHTPGGRCSVAAAAPPRPRPPRPDFTAVAAAGQTPPTSSALSSCLTLGRGLGGRRPTRPSCAACSLLPPREGGLCPRPAVQPALVRPPWARSSDLCRSSAGSQRAVGTGGALALPSPSPAAVGARSPGPPCSHAALLCPQGGRAEGGHSHDQDGPEEARDVRKPV